MSRPQGHSAVGRILSLKNSNDNIGNRIRDLPACSAVPQPTAPPRAPIMLVANINIVTGGTNGNLSKQNKNSYNQCKLLKPTTGTTVSISNSIAILTISYRISPTRHSNHRNITTLSIQNEEAGLRQFWAQSKNKFGFPTYSFNLILLAYCQKTYMTYHCCVYSEKLLMMDRETVRNM
jgi:hypothetical protein